MKFVLYYRGPLKANGGPSDKQYIRRKLHGQLKELWTQRPLNAVAHLFLNPADRTDACCALRDLSPFTFAPLVTEPLRLTVDLDITFMRPEEPGSLITQGGDIDNRLKTLFDALRMPKNISELPQGDQPQSSESPFYCLLEDDNLITGFRVSTERLLDANANGNEALLLIRVQTEVTERNWGNMGLD